MPLFYSEAQRSCVVVADNREVRAIPLNWAHPRDTDGQPLPLHSRSRAYTESELAELLAEGRTRQEIETWFMPDFSAVPEAEMGVAVYETTTEGTPLTPVFPNTREGLFNLLQYCTQHCATFADIRADIDTWARILGLQHILSNQEAS